MVAERFEPRMVSDARETGADAARRGVLAVQSVFAKDGVNADIHLFALLRKQV